MQDPETGKQGTVTFLPFNDTEYVVFGRDPEDSGKDPGRMRAFVTFIDGGRFLNLQVLEEDGTRAWRYANYSIAGDTMTVRLIDNELFSSRTFTSSDELRRSVQENLHDPRLYGREDGKDFVMTLVRAKS